jgi:hypothetical protein
VRRKYGVPGGGEVLQDGATVVVSLEKAGPLGIRFRDEVRDFRVAVCVAVCH